MLIMKQNQIKFTKVVRMAHKITKDYVKRFPCTYSVMFGTFFRFIWEVVSKKERFEAKRTVKGTAIYNNFKSVYTSITRQAVKAITFYVTVCNGDIKFFTSTQQSNDTEEFQYNLRPITDLIDGGMNIIPLIY